MTIQSEYFLKATSKIWGGKTKSRGPKFYLNGKDSHDTKCKYLEAKMSNLIDTCIVKLQPCHNIEMVKDMNV